MDDDRETEIESILAIFPEASRRENCLDIDIEFAPEESLVVAWSNEADGNAAPETSSFSRLPPMKLHFDLPNGYPESQPPIVSITTSPNFLPANLIQEQAQHIATMWEEMGRYQVIYNYIDYIQEKVRTSFGLSQMTVDSKHRIDLLARAAEEKKVYFERQAYECGVCLTTKSGKDCYQLRTCGHIFCRDCLQSCYEVHIREGSVWNVQCLAVDCKIESSSGKKIRPTVAPAELLEIPLAMELVQRYADLRRKKRMESDKNIVYCPREWCQAPARSKKYPVIHDVRLLTEVEDDEVATEEATDADEKLCVCERCNYAFCRICKSSWHGPFERCTTRDKAELSAEEKLAEAWIRDNTAMCPTCAARISKTFGCNHMTCTQCRGHCCFLCSSWLDPNNPYSHYQKPGPCFHRLFDLEDVISNENQLVMPMDEEIDLR